MSTETDQAHVPFERLAAVEGLSVRHAGRQLGVSRSTVQRWRDMAEAGSSRKTPSPRK
jgi:transposase